MAKAEFLSNTAERHHLPYLWANKVYDLGVLDFIPDETTTDDQVKLVFDLLKVRNVTGYDLCDIGIPRWYKHLRHICETRLPAFMTPFW